MKHPKMQLLRKDLQQALTAQLEHKEELASCHDKMAELAQANHAQSLELEKVRSLTDEAGVLLARQEHSLKCQASLDQSLNVLKKRKDEAEQSNTRLLHEIGQLKERVSELESCLTSKQQEHHDLKHDYHEQLQVKI